MTTFTGSKSLLFKPLKIANGKIELSHRVVLAPMTRNRCVPLNSESTKEKPNRVWFPDELVAEYYSQRTTEGGLLITEGIQPSLQGGGTPGTSGLYTPEQIDGWKKVVQAVHSKGGFIYAQLWHVGRVMVPQMTGLPVVSPSGLPWEEPTDRYRYLPAGDSEKVVFKDNPPVAMTVEDIKNTIGDFCKTAKLAVEECGFDGVEVHGGNGYLPEQFLSSNINIRTDAYGGSPEKRCTFTLELMDGLAEAVGEENMALRLSPFGLYNLTRGTERVQTWSYLCRELKSRHPRLSYISFIEPRYEQIHSTAEKDEFLSSWGLANVDLSHFKAIFGDTPFFSAGGWDDSNSFGVIESGVCDALLYGRYFTSNPDLVRRLRDGIPFRKYDRPRFYGPFEDREVGFTDYDPVEEDAITDKTKVSGDVKGDLKEVMNHAISVMS